MSQSSPEGIILGKGSKLISMDLSINKNKVLSIKTVVNKEITQQRIIEFQDALIQILEAHKEGDLKSQLFIDSYKSIIEELKEQLSSKA